MKTALNPARSLSGAPHAFQPRRACSLSGFSMIELLAVAAILLLVFVLYWGPGTTRNQQRQARQDCQSHLQRIYMALDIYAGEHAHQFPAATNALTSAEALDPLVPRYASDTALFNCPAVKRPPSAPDTPFRQQRIGYAYYMGRTRGEPREMLMSDQQVNTLPKGAGELAFSETGRPPGNNHGKLGGNFLYCDGSVIATPPRVPFALPLTQGVVLLNPSPTTP